MVLQFAAFLFIIHLTCGRLAINQEEHLTYFENILKIKLYFEDEEFWPPCDSQGVVATICYFLTLLFIV